MQHDAKPTGTPRDDAHKDANAQSKEAQVVLRVPAALKNKWVRASQSEGRKLTEWIVSRIESSSPQERK